MILAGGSDAVTAPDFCEPLTAWRVWRVVRSGDGLRLASVIKTSVWPPGEPLRAQCLGSSRLGSWLRRRSGHSVPDERCDCGIYAAWLPQVRQYLTELSLGWAPAPRVVGQVSLWGTVLECERGFRASVAYPARLYVPLDASPRRSQGSPDELARALEAYAVPVELLRAFRADAVDVLEQMELAALMQSGHGGVGS